MDSRLKENQSAQFAVLDIVLTKGDLQQCADAIMRPRSEYFFIRNEIDSIRFKAIDGTQLSFANWPKGERHVARGSSDSTPEWKFERNQLRRW